MGAAYRTAPRRQRLIPRDAATVAGGGQENQTLLVRVATGRAA